MNYMTSHLRKWWVVVVLVAVAAGLVLTVLPRIASAADAPQSLTLAPASSSPSVAPGGAVRATMNVLNDADDGYSVAVYANPYYVRGANYDPHFTALPGTTDASHWVTFDKTLYEVPGHKLINVPYTLRVPSGTAPGGYYAVIFVERQTTGGDGVQTRSRVGNILYITVEGAVRTGGSVAALRLPRIVTGTSAAIGVQVSNTGGVHFLTDAVFSARNMFGKEVLRTDVQRMVLPQTVRDISVPWKGLSPFGIYRVSRSATVAGKRQQLPDTTVLVAQPWVIAMFGVLCAIWIMALIRWLVRRRARRRAAP
jgi:hypothetical protein